MADNITNDNLDEDITSYIDNEDRDSEAHKKVYELISLDETVFKKYRSEVLTKELFRSRLPMMDVPSALVEKVNLSLDSFIQSAPASENSTADALEYSLRTNENFFAYLERLLITPVKIRRIKVPRYAFSIILLLIIIGTVIIINKQNEPYPLNPFIANGSEKSVMVQAVNNFHKILSGEVLPELRSSDAKEVSSYLKDKLQYDPFVPTIDNYDLMGAISNEYNGEKLAHLVYSSGDEILYIYETQTKAINHNCLDLPEQVHNEILKQKYYMCDKVDYNNCTMLIWYRGNLLCASVSTMPKQEMFTTLENLK